MCSEHVIFCAVSFKLNVLKNVTTWLAVGLKDILVHLQPRKLYVNCKGEKKNYRSQRTDIVYIYCELA
jgi:hypothetical protein